MQSCVVSRKIGGWMGWVRRKEMGRMGIETITFLLVSYTTDNKSVTISDQLVYFIHNHTDYNEQ